MTPDSVFTELYHAADLIGSDAVPDLSPLYHSLVNAGVRYSAGPIIGEGGMKEIIDAHDAHTERHVALARPKKTTGPERYDAFLREAHITARLEHPNIIQVFDMGIDEERRPFFTMEFKRGQSLRRIISNLRKSKDLDSYPLEARLEIILRICEAMSYAHSRHVLHLDLKPENIQVGTFGEVQVCDWGMGEIERGSGSEHRSEALLDPDLYGDQLEPAVKGTPGYMAPEQKKRHGLKSAQTDIFALGCLLYEVASLKPPSSRYSKPATSPAIAAIVAKACSESPKDRYPSAELMGQDVRRYLSGHSPEVENSGFRREARLFFRRNKTACLITLAFTSLLLGAALYFTQELRQSNKETVAALLKAEDALVAAENQRASAEDARAEAESSLNRYRQEQKYAAALLGTRKGTRVDNTVFVIHNLMMKQSISLSVLDNALRELDDEIEKDPSPDRRIWTLKAHLLFMTQRFQEAEKYYSVNAQSQEDLRALIPEFAPLVEKNDILPLKDLIRLLKKLANAQRDRQPLSEKIVIYDNLKRKSPAQTAKLIEVLLRTSNPRWSQGTFEYDPKSKHLEITGTFLRSLIRKGGILDSEVIPALPLIRLIPLESLDLGNSTLRSFKHLKGLTLRELDIRGHTPNDLKLLAGMTSLQKLIVLPGQLSPAQLDLIPDSVEVLQKPGR